MPAYFRGLYVREKGGDRVIRLFGRYLIYQLINKINNILATLQ